MPDESWSANYISLMLDGRANSLPVDRGEMLSLSELLVETPAAEQGRSARVQLMAADDDDATYKTCTIPRVAVVTGSEKSPPGGETL
jgi:hypothetical protein